MGFTNVLTLSSTSYVEVLGNLMALMLLVELDTLASYYYQTHLELHFSKLVRESNFLEFKVTKHQANASFIYSSINNIIMKIYLAYGFIKYGYQG